MEISQEQVQSSTQNDVQITIIKLVGEMDGSNFAQVITKAEEAGAAGARNLLIDLSELSFMSSAGLLALHRIAVLVRKLKMPDAGDGWTSLSDLKDQAGTQVGLEENVKLLNPQPRVMKSLQQVGYDRIFEIFSEREAALAAFH